MLYDGFKQRVDIEIAPAACGIFVNLILACAYFEALDLFRVVNYDALACNTVENWEIKLLVVCLEVHEKLVNLVHNLVYAGILFIDFVNQENRVDSLLE